MIPSWYQFVPRHITSFYLLCHFVAAGACSSKFVIYHRAAEVCPHRQQASLVDIRLAPGIWTINSGISYTCSIVEELPLVIQVPNLIENTTILILTFFSNSVILNLQFMTNKTPTDAKETQYWPRNSQKCQNWFFSFLTQHCMIVSRWLIKHGATLSRWFHMKQQHLHWAVHDPTTLSMPDKVFVITHYGCPFLHCMLMITL